MQLVVGLGNPGPSYARNRHNIGFMAADVIAHRYDFAPFRAKFQGHFSEGAIDGHKALILKPLTYMNESGRSVAEAARFYKVEPGDIVVIHDEIDLRPGKVRAKRGGGAAGHNGIRSIDGYIGPEYWRVRIGIGRSDVAEAAGHVLQNFTRDDEGWLTDVLAAVSDALPILLDGDAPGFMTKVAALAPPPKPAADDDDGV
jgi:PTH1 family peptidyl-tRNA hydrolase